MCQCSALTLPKTHPLPLCRPTAGGQSGDGVFCPAHPTRGLREPWGDPWAWGALLISSPCISPSPVLDSAGCQEKGPSVAIAMEMKSMEVQG